MMKESFVADLRAESGAPERGRKVDRSPIGTKSQSPDDTSLLGWTALAITGAFLLTFALGFFRFLVGSWRELAALWLAPLIYLAGLVLLARRFRPRSATQWRWVALMCPVLGAIAGAVYLGVSAATGAGPVITGLVWGAIHGALVARNARRAAAG